MLGNRRQSYRWLGLLVAVLVLTALAPLTGQTAPVMPAGGEMKLLLQPDMFADRVTGYITFWTKVKMVAAETGLPVIEAKNPYKEGARRIVYLDTANRDITDRHYIIRERVRLKGDQPAAAVELMLRYRIAGGATVPSEAVASAAGYKTKVSYDEDIVGFIDGVAGRNVGELSVSHVIKDVPAAALADKTIGGYAQFFPTLARLGLPLTTPLAASKGITVREYKISPGVFDFGQGMKGEAAISLWYDYDTGRPLAAEFSFDSGRGPKAPAAAVAKAEAFFGALQSWLGGSLCPGAAKTRLVTGGAD